MTRRVDTAEDLAVVVFLGLGAILASGLIALMAAWPIMLASGVLHGYFPSFPDFSFWQSLVLIWAWSLVWSRVKFTENDL